MDNKEINQGRRRFLTLATAGAGGVAALGVATPLVASFFPSEKAKAAGAPVEIDVSKIEAGQLLTAEWQGKPIWVLNRTEQQQKDLPTLDGELVDPTSEVDHQPADCKNPLRSLKPGISLLSVSVPIWAALPHSVRMWHLLIWVRAGRGGSSVLATVPSLIWQAAYIKACRLRPTWLFRLTNI